MKVILAATISLMLIFVGYTYAFEVLAGPEVFTDVPDGTAVPFDVGTQPPGFYYVEWTEPTGTSLGIFGADTDLYAGGKAWRDGEPIDDGIFDFYMALTTDTGELADWIIAKTDADPNIPLALRQGHPDLPPEEYTSLGQSFTATKEFTQLGVRAVLWTIPGGGYTVTLYSDEPGATSVEPTDKLATTWASIKNQ